MEYFNTPQVNSLLYYLF